MVSSSTLFSLSVFFALFLFASSSLSPKKVHVELYYETLDSNCSMFIAKELPKLLQNGLSSFVDLELIPFGMGKIVKEKLICEHGGNECFLNEVHTCSIHVTTSMRAIPFISCVEEKVLRDKMEDWHLCFEETGLSSNTVANCFFNSTLCLELEAINAEKTKLAKPHFLPWVVLNGRSLAQDYGSMIKEICKEIGTCKPNY